MNIDFVKTLEASAPYIPGTIYFESNTGLIKVATTTNQYNVYSGVRHAEYDTSTNTLTIQNGNGEEIYIDLSGLPSVSAADNGKILMVVNGQWALVSPSVLYSGSGVPNNTNGNNGDIYVQTD